MYDYSTDSAYQGLLDIIDIRKRLLFKIEFKLIFKNIFILGFLIEITNTWDWGDNSFLIGNNLFINFCFDLKPDGEISLWILSFVLMFIFIVTEAIFFFFFALEPNWKKIFLL